MYKITIEPRHKLMHIVLTDFWSVKDMESYIIELQRQAEILAGYGGCKRILVDMSEYRVQLPDIASRHAKIMDHGISVMDAKIAVVFCSALARLQSARIVKFQGQETFADEVAARHWLLST